MADPSLTPWWVGIGISIVTTLGAVIGKLWTELRGARVELGAANDRIVALQVEASKRSDDHQREHRKDLRRLAGLSSSMDPPPRSPFAVYPTIIAAEDAEPYEPGRRPLPPRSRRRGE